MRNLELILPELRHGAACLQLLKDIAAHPSLPLKAAYTGTAPDSSERGFLVKVIDLLQNADEPASGDVLSQLERLNKAADLTRQASWALRQYLPSEYSPDSLLSRLDRLSGFDDSE